MKGWVLEDRGGNRKDIFAGIRWCVIACATCLTLIPWHIEAHGEKFEYREGKLLNNPGPAVQAGFGVSLAVQNGKIVVGAPHAISQKGETGKVYVFEFDSGRLLYTFRPPTPLGEELFGLSVGWAGDLIAVGAPQAVGANGSQKGAVYLFRSDTGVLVRTIYSPNPSPEIFGHAVKGRGEYLVVGDPGAHTAEHFHTGAAYLFNAKTGVLVHEFIPPESNRGQSDRFGHAVGFTGSSVVVAAPLGGDAPLDQGVVYLYDLSSGKMQHRLTSPHPQHQEYFGWGIAGDEQGVVIGAPGHQSGDFGEGAAYLFGANGLFQRSLFSPDAKTGERFGETVGLMSRYTLVAAPGRIRNGFAAGGILVFERMEGRFRFVVENSASVEGIEDEFGFSIDGSTHLLAVGSPFGGTGHAIDAGVVHQFQFAPPGLPEGFPAR